MRPEAPLHGGGPPPARGQEREPPRVLALHVPALPLQRLLRTRGAPGRPVAILAEGRVVHCDAAARAAGVSPGQTAAEALSACGRLEGVPLDPAADRAALRALAETVLLLAPAVEVAEPDTLLLDASAAHLLAPAAAGRSPEAGEQALAERSLAAAAEMGYRAQVAVASGRAPAAALARHGVRDGEGAGGRGGSRWVRVPPGQAARALAGLPLASLGLGQEVVERLRGLGVRDAGALVRLPPGSLAHRFGPDGVRAARLARGEDGGPLVPYTPGTLPEEVIELEAPAEGAEPVLFALKRLADRVSARLSGRGLGATRLRLTLKLDPRGEERILVPLAQPTASAARWLVPARELLFSLRLPGAVVALRLAALEVGAIPAEQLAFGDRPEALAALEVVLARIATRLGDEALFAAEPVERHRPEGAYRPVPFRAVFPGRSARPAPTGEAGSGPRPGSMEFPGRSARPAPTGEAGSGPHPGSMEFPGRSARPAPTGEAGSGPRPGSMSPTAAVAPRSKARGAVQPAPEPGPPLPRPTRLLAVPTPVVAEGEGGRITALRVDGRARAVIDLAGPERLAGEWWSAPYERDYFRIRLEGLGECWVYRDGASGRLWLHGFFD